MLGAPPLLFENVRQTGHWEIISFSEGAKRARRRKEHRPRRENVNGWLESEPWQSLAPA